MSEVHLAVRRRNILGEGPVWDAARGRLWWVDIKGGRLEWLDPASGADGGVDVAGQVSAVAPRAGGGALLAARKGEIGLLDPRTGAFERRLALEPDRPNNRCNDGNVDLAGRFWFGTMDDRETRDTGALYRLDADGTCHRILDGMGIPNTLVCSPDGTRLYVADSRRQALDILPIDPATGATGDLRRFVSLAGAAGAPDGSAVDEEGYVWNAQWGAARLVRYAPDGRVDRVVPMPVDHPSSCAFGGDDLATLYVTTARWLMPADRLAEQPLAGSLLALRPGVRGLALPPFAGWTS